MATKNVRPDPGALERHHREQRRRVVKTKVGVYVLGALVVAGVVVGVTTLRSDAPRPANQPVDQGKTLSGPFFLDLQNICLNCLAKPGERTPLPENLAGGFAYVASPDGTRVAYNTCCSGADVMTVANIDGTGAQRLQVPEGLNIYGARWSPDGTKLVYQLRDGGGDTELTGDVGNLFVHDLSTGRRTQITDLELTRAWWWLLSPSFSPDGRNVLFHLPRGESQVTKWDVWSVPVTGGERTLVLRNAAFPMLSAYAPNDVSIAFLSPRPDDLAGRSIMVTRLLQPPDLSDLRGTLVEANVSIQWPTLSPDGRNIAYQDGGSIYVITGRGPGLAPVSTKVAVGETAEWLDNDTLIVVP